MGRLIKIGAILCGTFLLVSGGDSKTMAAERGNDFSLSKSSITIKEGKSITIKTSDKATIKVSFSPETVSKKISLSADKKDVVRLVRISDYFYKVKGLKAGKALITIKSIDNPSVKKDLTVTVKKKSVKKTSGVRKLTGKNFEKEIEKGKGRAVIMIGTSWCGYCQLLDPIFKEAAKKDSRLRYYHVDGDEERYGLVELFGVEGFPTIYLVENQRTIDAVGYYKGWKADDYIKWANEKKVQR